MPRKRDPQEDLMRTAIERAAQGKMNRIPKVATAKDPSPSGISKAISKTTSRVDEAIRTPSATKKSTATKAPNAKAVAKAIKKKALKKKMSKAKEPRLYK